MFGRLAGIEGRDIAGRFAGIEGRVIPPIAGRPPPSAHRPAPAASSALRNVDSVQTRTIASSKSDPGDGA